MTHELTSRLRFHCTGPRVSLGAGAGQFLLFGGLAYVTEIKVLEMSPDKRESLPPVLA